MTSTFSSRGLRSHWLLKVLGGALVTLSCADPTDSSDPGSGGRSSGGTSSGGTSSGGTSSGGVNSGGLSSGGSSGGASDKGGAASGGSQAGTTMVAGAGMAFGGSAGVGGSAGATSAGGSHQGGAAGAANGGASGNAGSSGMGSGGSTAAAGCRADYLLCEDFETTDVGKVPSGWTAHGMASVAEDQARGGKRSLKISPTDNGERRIYHPTPMIGAEHWGRVHYRVKLPVPNVFVHSTLVAFAGKGPTEGDAEFRFVDTVKDASGKHQFLFNVQLQSGREFGSGSNYDYTFQEQWHCAEWHVNAADQSYQFYYDAKQVLSFTKGAGNYQDSELPTSFSEVRVGWNNYQSAPPGFTAWIDDFVLDDARVGCAPMP